jgi:hypothetical protein
MRGRRADHSQPGSVQHIIACGLRLRGGVDDEFAIIAQPLEPAHEIGGGIVYGAVFDPSDPAQIGG